ncbi:MAG: hypothetical protein QW056_02430 [Candidatus Bathyarchaeia archaeon]
MSCEHVVVISPFQVLEKVVDQPLRIRGVALTVGMSRNKNVYTAEELEAFASKLAGAPMYVEHVAVPNAIGKVTKAWFDGERLWYEAEIYDDEVAEKIRRGLIRHVSVGADYERIDVVDGRIPQGLHNAELSLVAVPGIPEANIQILEALRRSEVSEKAVAPHETPKALEDRKWDAEAAEQRIRKWASSDGSGEKDKIDWDKYREGFAWFNVENLEDFGSYKLPHHDVIDGELRVVWRGVTAAMGVLMGARGGVDIPHADRGAVYRHLAAHYRQFERTPPELVEVLIANLEAELKGHSCHEKSSRQEPKTSSLVSERLLNEPKEPMMPVSDVISMLEGVLPGSMIVQSWGLGPQRLCQDIRRIIWDLRRRVGNG